jgi:Kef-type K+ transport system membrane component KefB
VGLMLNYLLLAGIALCLGLVIGKGTYLLKITGVVGYIITGIIIGPDVLNIVHLSALESETIANFSLGIVAFIIGGELTLRLLRSMGKSIIIIILGESFGAFFLVLIGVYLVTGDLVEAVIFAALAPASAPAGTVAVIHEYRAKGKLTDSVLAVVGFDDGLAILIYAFAMAAVILMISGGGFSLPTLVITPILEIMGALIVGGGIGCVIAFLIRRVVEREELIALSLTSILLTAGIALYFGISLILSCMVLGIVIINLFPQENKPVFESIKSITLPIYVLFFVVAGLNMKIGLLTGIGILGFVYIIFRSLGLISGSYISAYLSKTSKVIRNNLGLAILSQAGVAIGLSLIASHRLAELGKGELGSLIVTTIAATTVVFEIIGPLGAHYAISKAGEIGKA